MVDIMENKVIMYKLYVGLNDKDTKKQEIPTEKAMDIICKCLAKQGIYGMTENLENGRYIHKDGTITMEKSWVIEMFFVERVQIINAISDIKTLLNQEAVVLCEKEVKSELI